MKQSYVAKRVMGRTIREVVLRRYRDRQRGRVIYEPTLVLDNGAELSFQVQESDIGIYGVSMHLYVDKKKPTVLSTCDHCMLPLKNGTCPVCPPKKANP